MSRLAPSDRPCATAPSPGLVNLADPDVRNEARLLLHRGVIPELVAAEIGVTVDELAWSLRRVRRASR